MALSMLCHFYSFESNVSFYEQFSVVMKAVSSSTVFVNVYVLSRKLRMN